MVQWLVLYTIDQKACIQGVFESLCKNVFLGERLGIPLIV